MSQFWGAKKIFLQRFFRNDDTNPPKVSRGSHAQPCKQFCGGHQTQRCPEARYAQRGCCMEASSWTIRISICIGPRRTTRSEGDTVCRIQWTELFCKRLASLIHRRSGHKKPFFLALGPRHSSSHR